MGLLRRVGGPQIFALEFAGPILEQRLEGGRSIVDLLRRDHAVVVGVQRLKEGVLMRPAMEMVGRATGLRVRLRVGAIGLISGRALVCRGGTTGRPQVFALDLGRSILEQAS